MKFGPFRRTACLAGERNLRELRLPGLVVVNKAPMIVGQIRNPVYKIDSSSKLIIVRKGCFRKGATVNRRRPIPVANIGSNQRRHRQKVTGVVRRSCRIKAGLTRAITGRDPMGLTLSVKSRPGYSKRLAGERDVLIFFQRGYDQMDLVL